MARFGINTDRAFGVSMAALAPDRAASTGATTIWRWRSGRPASTRRACSRSLIDEPKKVTAAQMDAWAADFNSWDLCDQACMKLFARTPFVEEKIGKWAERRARVRPPRRLRAARRPTRSTARRCRTSEFLPFLRPDRAARHRRRATSSGRRSTGRFARSASTRPRCTRPPWRWPSGSPPRDDKTARWIGKDAVRELSDPAQAGAARGEAGR